MPVDSNRYQIFYCPPVVIAPQVQRPVPRQQSYNQAAICSSSQRPQSHPPPQSPIKILSSSSSNSGSFPIRFR